MSVALSFSSDHIIVYGNLCFIDASKGNFKISVSFIGDGQSQKPANTFHSSVSCHHKSPQSPFQLTLLLKFLFHHICISKYPSPHSYAVPWAAPSSSSSSSSLLSVPLTPLFPQHIPIPLSSFGLNHP